MKHEWEVGKLYMIGETPIGVVYGFAADPVEAFKRGYDTPVISITSGTLCVLIKKGSSKNLPKEHQYGLLLVGDLKIWLQEYDLREVDWKDLE